VSIVAAIGSSIGRAIGSAMAGGGAEPAFDPATLFTGGKKGIWIKPRDWSTLKQSYIGTTDVTVATDPVGYAADQSGNAVNMVNAATEKRPVAITVGGVNAIDFDGVDDKLASGAVVAGTWTAMDFFIVVNLDTFSASGWLIGDDNVGRYFGVAQNGNGSSTASGAGSPSYKINGVAVPGGTSATRDQLYDAISTGGWLVVEANGLDLSAWIQLQYGNYTNFQLNGKCAELILCESVSDAVRAQVRTYMGAAVGLSI
jgi:hypothetical protein